MKQKYDFETIRPRVGMGALKWDGMYAMNSNVSEDVIPLSVADMEFIHAPEIGEAIGEYCKKEILGYSNGQPSYYQAIVDWMNKRHGWKIEADWIVEYPGVVPALYHCVKAFTQPGEKVLLLTPVYYPFYSAIKKGERELVQSELLLKGDHYEIDFNDFEEKAKDPAVKLFIMSNPHNPVGRVWTNEELTRLGQICIDNDVLVVSDEIHKDLIMPGYKHTVFASINEVFSDRCITCTAPSKTFNLAGMCTSGIIISNRDIRKRLYDFREEQAMFFCNSAGRVACETAYNNCEGWLEELLVVLDNNRKTVETFFAENMPEVKVIRLEGTYLQWLDFRAWGMSYKELEEFMVKEALIFGDEGYIFGKSGEGFERLNLACPTRVLEAALDRILEARKNYVTNSK